MVVFRVRTSVRVTSLLDCGLGESGTNFIVAFLCKITVPEKMLDYRLIHCTKQQH
jgi:hypothetical protein